jgi:hypothetical protein
MENINKVIAITNEVEHLGFSSREMMEYMISQDPKLIKELERLTEEMKNTLPDDW